MNKNNNSYVTSGWTKGTFNFVSNGNFMKVGRQLGKTSAAWRHFQTVLTGSQSTVFIDGIKMEEKTLKRCSTRCNMCYEMAVRKKLGLSCSENLPEEFQHIGIYKSVCPHYNKVKKGITDQIDLDDDMVYRQNRKLIKKIASWGWGLLDARHNLVSTCPNFFEHLVANKILPCEEARPKKRGSKRLNKKICQTCVKERNNGVWTKNDDKLWSKHGMVRCACKPIHLTHHAQPEECSFFMEQTLCRGYNNKSE